MINVLNVSLRYGSRKLFEDVNIKFTPGNCYGVIGANGAGKSTFLKILSGEVEPNTGEVVIAPNTRMSVLNQDHYKYDEFPVLETVIMGNERLHTIMKEKDALYAKPDFSDEDGIKAAELEGEFAELNGWEAESEASSLLQGLGIGTDAHYKLMSELTGAEKVKVLLAQALFGNPGILILDEPTNHLDEEHIVWLTRYLQEYENSFILVSHDTDFINNTCNVIYHIENAELTRYKGNYDEFVRLNEIKKRQEESAYEKQVEERKKLEDFVARNKARVATRGMANSRQKILDKMEILERPKEKLKPTFNFRNARAAARIIFETKDLVLGYNEPLTKPLNFQLERGQKIALKGMNGIGKSTLLRTLLGMTKPFDGQVELGDYLEVGYFEQESSMDNYNTALDDVWQEYPVLTNYEVRQALAKCGLTTEHITSQVRVLSGGEAAKVRLCKLMLKDINFLVLDEPTNHLDVEAKDELKKAIKEFKGTVLLVCHEPEFYSDVVDDVWNIEDFTTKIV